VEAGKLPTVHLLTRPAALALAAALLVLGVWALQVPILEHIELETYDLRVQARGALPPSPAVAIVAVDERSLAAEGRWPWPRARLAALVDALSRDGARVVAFDVSFPEPEGAAADRALAAALERSRAKVVLGYFLHRREEGLGYHLDADEIDRRVARVSGSRYPIVRSREPDLRRVPLLDAYAPLPNLELVAGAAASSGFVGMASDSDGVLRRAPLAVRIGGEVLAPLALVAAWEHLGRPQLALSVGRHGVEGVELGDRFVPTDERGQLLIDWLGPPGTVPSVPATDVLRGAIPPGTFRDKLVLVGATAVGTHDLRTSPFGPAHAGVEINATVADGLLTGRFAARPDWWIAFDVLAVVILAALTAAGVSRTRALGGLAVLAALSAGYVLLALSLFVARGAWLAVVYPVLAVALVYTALTAHRFLSEERERRRLGAMLGQYVAPDVVAAMLADPGRLRLGGAEKVLTVLFSDLEGFTSQCERLAPGEMVEILAAYYERMTEEVFAHGGTLKEYVGDELMAFFGAPLEQADHAARACAAALGMRERRRALAAEWAAAGRPALRARTGVNSGPMLVGNLGSRYRFAYGVLGDEVNLGSRLEGLNRLYGTEILVGEGTARLVGPAFLLREVDVVRVKGKAQAARVFELLARGGEALPEAQASALALYADGLAAYRARRWGEAAALFERALASWPEDGPARTMAQRCRAYARRPPAETWDGAFEQSGGLLEGTG
jgi:adenylate cyclase